MIQIDPSREITQSAYSARTGKKLSQIANELRAGKLKGREIPELGITLIQLDEPIPPGATVPAEANLFEVPAADLVFHFQRFVANHVKLTGKHQQQADALAAAQAENEELQREVGSLTEQVNKLTSQNSELNSLSERLKGVNSALNSKLGESQATNKELNQRLTNSTNECAKLRDQLENERAELVAVRKQLKRLQDSSTGDLKEWISGLLEEVRREIHGLKAQASEGQ